MEWLFRDNDRERTRYTRVPRLAAEICGQAAGKAREAVGVLYEEAPPGTLEGMPFGLEAELEASKENPADGHP